MEDNLNPCFLIGMMFGIAIGSLLVGAILKLAVYTFNLMAGGPDSRYAVPARSFSDTVQIGLVMAVMSSVFQVVMLFAFPGRVPAGIPDRQQEMSLIRLLVQLCFYLVSFTSFILLVKYRFPTTFMRAFLVVIWYFVIVLLIVCLATAVVFVCVALSGAALRGG